MARSLESDDAAALVARADALLAKGEHGAAIALLEQASELNPQESGCWHLLGVAYFETNRPERAERCCRRALELEPRHARALATLGALLQRRGAQEEAELRYRDAVAADPALGPAWFNLGTLLLNQLRNAEALEPLAKAVAIDPRRAQWNAALGTAFDRAGRTREAIASFEAAIRIDPGLALAHEGLGICLVNAGRVSASIENFRKAIETDAGAHRACSNLLFALHYLPGQDAEALYREHLGWERRYGARPAPPRHRNGADPQRRLRIGYVSPDFRGHAVAHFIRPVLASHDPARVETVCYSDVELEDAMSGELRQMAGLWRRSAWLDDERLAAQILEDRIDILVDLAGHSSGGQRMPLFARKPAPVQVSWIGYPDTTGLAAIDYRFTDSIADPEGASERLHSEKLVRLPQGFLCYSPAPESPEVSTPALLARGRPTLGCFNNLSKLSAPLVALWARLLAELPQARLALKSFGLASADARQSLQAQFASHGIAPGRLEILGPEASFAGHLARYGAIDLALDSFPYNGTTTTCEALWMGVPVVTLAGNAHVSRVGASLLHRVGLDELVATSEEAYLQKALALARDAGRLRALRAELRERMRASPLLDAAGFTRAVEAAYRDMWRRWCEARAP